MVPEQVTQKVTSTFVKGLITEASEMNYPEDASIDESNCDLNRDGTRTRRKGLLQVGSHTATTPGSNHTGTFLWTDVGGVGGRIIQVVQVGARLYFYRVASGNPLQYLGTTNLVGHAQGTVAIAEAPMSATQVKGDLVVVSAGMRPVRISYDGTNFSPVGINIRVRDYKWLSDKESLRIETTSDTPARRYDTYNAGWSAPWEDPRGTTNLDYWRSSIVTNVFPALRIPPWTSKDDNGEVNVGNPYWFRTAYFSGGNTLIGNGKYILDFFRKDRSAVSGVGGIPVEEEATRFTTVATFAGRVWYAGLSSSTNASTILYSKIIEDMKEVGQCHTENDTTSEYYYDVLPTDGGTITIPDCGQIYKLHTFGNSIFVFADNGIWEITGPSGYFTSTEYSINKVTSTGVHNDKTFVSVDGVPFWWSKTGISTLGFSSENGRPSEENLSVTTIQRFWESIPPSCRKAAKGSYDPVNKRIYWTYSDVDTDPTKYNSVLVLDITLQAFFPWKFNPGSNRKVFSCEFLPDYQTQQITTFDPVTVLGTPVTVETVPVGSNITSYTTLDTGIGAVYWYYFEGSNLKVATMSSEDFKDFGEYDAPAHVVGAYDFSGSLWSTKSAKYVMVYMREPAVLGGASLFLSSHWDFDTSRGIKTRQQCYRLRLGATAGSTKVKILGRGKVCNLRWESEEGKPFELIGYQGVTGVANRL